MNKRKGRDRDRDRDKRDKIAASSSSVRQVLQQFVEAPYALLESPCNGPCSRSDHIRKKNCEGNPFCLYGLGEYQKGIWKGLSPFYDQLGPDFIALDRRCKGCVNPNRVRLARPAGLRNLGATCYLNALMQSLFHNALFRARVYEAQVQGDFGNVFAAFQEAFTHMQWGYSSVYDLKDLTRLLELVTDEQQDPQEFSKLFLSKLEEICQPVPVKRNQGQSERATLTQIFRGVQTYVTKCCGCQKEKCADAPFYELEIPLDGVSNLEEGLARYMGVDVLSGDNQYECDHCGTKCNAERRTQIKQLPEVLFLQLMRYVYNRTTFSKEKLKVKVAFPKSLRVQGTWYELVAVLYHKGLSAYGGHYVADVLDWTTAKWWTCDDETVVITACPASDQNQGGAPIEMEVVAIDSDGMYPSEEDAAGEQDSSESEDNGKSPKSKEKLCSTQKRKYKTTPGKNTKKSKSENSTGTGPLKRENDAYMFAYVRQSSLKLGHEVPVRQPTSLRQSVDQANETFIQAYQDCVKARKTLDDEADGRRKAYEDIFIREIPTYTAAHHGEGFALLPTVWLKQWITGVRDRLTNCTDLTRDEAPSSISSTKSTALFSDDVRNLQHVCKHSQKGLSPKDLVHFKCFNIHSYTKLLQVAGVRVDFPLTTNTFRCGECVDELYGTAIGTCEKTQKFEDVIRTVEADNSEDVDVFQHNRNRVFFILANKFMSGLKKLTQQLVRESEASVKSSTSSKSKSKKLLGYFKPPAANTSTPIDQSGEEVLDFNVVEDPMDEHHTQGTEIFKDSLDETVNSSLLCPHRNLMPFAPKRKKFRYVTDRTWQKVCQVFPQAIPLMHTTTTCDMCIRDTESKNVLRRSQKDLRLFDSSIKCFTPLRNYSYRYPVFFTTPTNIQPTSTVELQQAMNVSFYLVHSEWLNLWRRFMDDLGATLPPPLTNNALKCQHGAALVPLGLQSLINGGVWEDTGSLSGGMPSGELVTAEQWNQLVRLHGPIGQHMQNRDNIHVTEEVFQIRLSFHADIHTWNWEPNACPQCLQAAEEIREHTRTHFENKCIRVTKIGLNELVPATVAEQIRPNKRTRNCSSKNTSTVSVTSTDNVALLRLKIFQELGVEPNRQTLFFRGESLTDPMRTLHDLGIKAENTVYMRVSKDRDEYEDGVCDMYACLQTNQGAEMGFRNTLLTQTRPQTQTHPHLGDQNEVTVLDVITFAASAPDTVQMPKVKTSAKSEQTTASQTPVCLDIDLNVKPDASADTKTLTDIETLMDMGFSLTDSKFALSNSDTFDEAVEMLITSSLMLHRPELAQASRHAPHS